MSSHVLDVAVLRYHSVVNSDPEYDLMNVLYVLIEIQIVLEGSRESIPFIKVIHFLRSPMQS